MTKLKHVGEYIINPASIAYMKHIFAGDGGIFGTHIVFNAYAAAASDVTGYGFEPLSIQIMGKTPVEIMDFLNDEPVF